MREHILYAVIILNYNTAEDCEIAVKSVISSATADNYKICLVDNASTKKDEIDKLKKIKNYNKNIILLLLNENKGYAYGNNMGARYINDNYDCSYFVIMNPDVEIIQKSTVESLINDVDGKKIIGSQALVNCNDISEPPNKQLNIRRVMSYPDILINSSWILKIFFKRKHNWLVYKDDMPYNTKIKFEVPSGAFFVIDASFFTRINMFDERTFLYVEEMILGFKVKEENASFVLNPLFSVNHYQGKSTKSHGKQISGFSERCLIDSTSVYLKYYLKVGKLAILLYRIIATFSLFLKRIVWKIKYNEG